MEWPTYYQVWLAPKALQLIEDLKGLLYIILTYIKKRDKKKVNSGGKWIQPWFRGEWGECFEISQYFENAGAWALPPEMHAAQPLGDLLVQARKN